MLTLTLTRHDLLLLMVLTTEACAHPSESRASSLLACRRWVGTRTKHTNMEYHFREVHNRTLWADGFPPCLCCRRADF